MLHVDWVGLNGQETRDRPGPGQDGIKIRGDGEYDGAEKGFAVSAH
jgi:hypothetical protein